MYQSIKNTASTFLLYALAALSMPSIAHAMNIDFEPIVGTISGTNTMVFEFDISATGLYSAVLTDLGVPAPFDLLGLALADDNGFVFNEVVGTDMLTLNFSADPGAYLAIVGGIAGGDLNIGTFGLEISDLPVPAAGLLFPSALVAVAALMRRRAT